MKKLFFILLIGMCMISFTSAFNWTNIYSYYKLDNTTGNAIDAHSTNDLTEVGTIASQTGIINNARGAFNTTKYFTNTDMGYSLTSASDYSFNIWIYRTGNSDYVRLLSVNDQVGGEYYFNIALEPGELIKAAFGKWGTTTTSLYSNETLALNTWTMITVTHNGTTKEGKIYVNAGTPNSTTETVTDGTESVRLSIGSELVSQPLINGILDEAGVWLDVLTQSEVTELYNGGSGLPFPVIVEINVILDSPTNDSLISDTEINFTTVLTSSGDNFTNATYFIWYNNGTIFNQTSVTLPNSASANYTLQINNFSFEDYKWNVYACISNGNCSFADSNSTFTVSPFTVDAVTYNTTVFETSTQNFSINISANPTVNSVSGLFWYNGSSYTALISNPSSGKYVALSIIDIPLQTSSGNMSFKWQFDFILTDASEQQQNTTDYSNEVNRTYIFICNSTYTSEIINFTTRNAENPFPKVNGTFKSAWQWYLGSGGVFRNMSYEDVNENKSDFDFCGFSDGIDYIFTVDIEADATAFSKNFYYFTEATKTSGNATETDLYLLNATLSTPTTLLVRDRYQRVIEDVLIFIQLYDVGTDSFYTVTMGKTNQNGEDIVYLNWFDSLYRFILVQNETTILTTDSYKVGDTPQIFQIEDDIVYDFDKFRDFQYSLTFNNATNNFVLTYIKPNGLVESGCLRVINRNSTGDTEICETCSTSASATLYCNIASAGNGTFIATFYATGSLAVIDWIYEEIGIGMSETIFNLLNKDDAAFYTILMSSLVLLIFLVSPVFGILGILAGMLLSSALGFSLISYGSFLFISIVGGTIIWLLKR